tara:strand:- start:437 stop:673 length:237 start_codon:yes stop_codon:yes gene_type:complete
MSDTNGWGEYRQLVLTEIQRLADEIRYERETTKTSIDLINKRNLETQKEIAMLKVQCGIWGLAGGLIPTITALVMTKL